MGVLYKKLPDTIKGFKFTNAEGDTIEIVNTANMAKGKGRAAGLKLK
jgi:hypothetical protein